MTVCKRVWDFLIKVLTGLAMASRPFFSLTPDKPRAVHFSLSLFLSAPSLSEAFA